MGMNVRKYHRNIRTSKRNSSYVLEQLAALNYVEYFLNEEVEDVLTDTQQYF